MSNSNVGGASSLGSAIRQIIQEEIRKTVADVIAEEMSASGTQEAAAFNVTVNGVTHQVVSDADPALQIEIQPTDNVRVEKLQSAAAGL